MKNRFQKRHRAVQVLALLLALTLFACSPSTPPQVNPAATPSATPVATPATGPSPTVTASPPPAPSPIATAPPIPKPTVSAAPSITATAKPSPTSTPSPTPTAPAEVTIAGNRAVVDFPNKITFAIEGSSMKPVKSLNLEYGTNKRSLVPEMTRVEPEYARDVRINTTWAWEMKKTGSIPPGAAIWWQWRVLDSEGRTYVTPRQTLKYEDPRLQWQVQSLPLIDIYYSSQSAGFINDLTAGLTAKLAKVELQVTIPADRKPKVHIYPSSQLMMGAWLFLQPWTGAFAVPWYNTILIPVTASNLEWAKGTLAHETTHLLVGEAVFGPFGQVPTWLNEGLAQYSEGEMDLYYRGLLNNAIKDNKLISVRSLGSTFPTDANQSSLAYAESHSLVTFLIDSYGWTKIRDLLAVFKEGSTFDNALKKVFSLDTAGVEKQWRAKIGAN